MVKREGISIQILDTTASGKSLIVDYHYYGQELPPDAKAHAKMSKRFYFDLRLLGLTGGNATVGISHESVEAGCRIQHWEKESGRWVDHDAVVDPQSGTITAKFDVLKLNGSPIVIGT